MESSNVWVTYTRCIFQLFEIHHLIGRLGLYVFEEVCQIIKCWESLNQLKVPISVNLCRVAIKSKILMH